MKKKDFELNEFIAVYTEADLDCFGLGYVLAVNDDYLLIQSIDPKGDLDGLTLYAINDIILVERKTKYCDKIEKLIELKKVKLKEYNINQNDYVDWLLRKSKEEKRLINIQLLGNPECTLFGIVEKIEKETCSLVQINQYGIKDGKCQFDIENISSIKYDSNDDFELSLLLKNSK